MKKLILLGCLILMSACTSKNEFGNCVGVFDDKDPKLTYKLSVNNTVVATVFSAFIFPPILVIANEAFCPVGPK